MVLRKVFEDNDTREIHRENLLKTQARAPRKELGFETQNDSVLRFKIVKGWGFLVCLGRGKGKISALYFIGNYH